MTSSWAIASARAMTGRAPKASARAPASVTASSTPSGFLGHADPGSTLRTYTHLIPSSSEGCRPTIDSAVRVLMCTQRASARWEPVTNGLVTNLLRRQLLILRSAPARQEHWRPGILGLQSFVDIGRHRQIRTQLRSVNSACVRPAEIQPAEASERRRRRGTTCGRPRPTMARVPPRRRGHDGSGSGASGADISATSTKNVCTRPMPSRSCATSCIARSEEAGPPLRKSSSETRTYSGTLTGFLSKRWT